VYFEDAVSLDHADAVKMHAAVLRAVIDGNGPPPADLTATALRDDWDNRLPKFIRQYMTRNGRWYAIPVGVHQGNAMWVNERHLAYGDRLVLDTWPELLQWFDELAREVPYPLALGALPWQIGMLFDSIVLGQGGEGLYRACYVDGDPEAFRRPAFQQCLALLLRLRRYVDEEAWGSGWADNLRRVVQDRASVQVMGDWAAPMLATLRDTEGVVIRASAPATTDCLLYVIDFFVPFNGRAEVTTHATVASALSSDDVQAEFACAKGCRRAFGPWPDGIYLPSMTLEQACAPALTSALVGIIADGLGAARSPSQIAAQLGASASQKDLRDLSGRFPARRCKMR
jgi:ABC-type glycerol-3-phosphate transport system substrate-binding protein